MADIGFLERLGEFLRSRRFQWILIFGLTGLVVVYLLFVSLFFNPFEEKLADTAAVVPAEVDYFVRWRDAGAQFSDFPRLAVWDEVESSEPWDELERSGAMARLAEKSSLGSLLEQMAGLQELLPAGLSMEDDFLREIALTGNGRLAFDSSFDGMLMLRGSFKVRAGLAMLDWGFVQDKLPESVQVDDLGDGVYKLPQFELFGFQDAYLSRIRDVVLLASRPEWIEQAEALEDRSGQESLASASVFHDNVTAYLDPAARPVEVFLRWRPLAERIGTWPSPEAEGVGSRFLARFFDSSMLKFASGYAEPESDFDMRVSGDLLTEGATDFQKAWLDGSTVSAQRIKDFADMTPADCFLFGAVAGDPAAVLEEVYSLVAPDLRRILDEAVQDSGQYQGMRHLMQEIGGMVRPGVGLAMRRDDYPAAESDPDHDGAPVPLWAVYGEVRNPESYENLRQYFVDNWRRFTGGATDRVQTVKLPNLTEITSFVSPIVPGTGEIVMVYHAVIDTVIVSNSYKLLNAITSTAFPASAARPPAKLRTARSFERTLEAAGNGAHLLLWVDPSNARHWLEEASAGMAEVRFQDEQREQWRQKRPAVEARVRAELFPDRAALTPQEESRLIDAVDRALVAEDSSAARRLPELTNEVRLGWLPYGALDWASMVFRSVRGRSAQLHVQAQVAE